MRTLILAAVLLSVAAPSYGQGWIEPVRPMPAFGVHKLRTSVIVHVNGRVATVEVEEHFRNDGPALGEGDYLYPLPGEAVFNNFSLYQGEQELRGETMDASQARSIYEEIVRRKRDPALIELAGHGLLRARVFPIAGGETRKITLRYTQILARAGDALQFKYAAGSPGQSQPQPMVRQVLEDNGMRRRPETVPVSFTIIVDDASAFGDPFSPTHEVRIQRSGKRLTVRPDGELHGDFDVFLPLRGAAVGLTMVAHRPSSEDGFFMLTLSPAKVNENAAPRDVTVVLDVSGSMSGEKMEQARASMHAMLRSLSNVDRFRLIAFSDQVRLYRREWLAAGAANVAAAETWIDNLQAGGGTNIAGALEEAFEATSPAERLPFVIFVTDGLPSVGESNPERLAVRAESRRGRNRVFAFGVGFDVNTYLLDRLSSAARGTTQYVRPGEDVERPIANLAAKIRFPVLTDLRIADAPVKLDEIYPIDLPDLFADEELLIVGRYHGTGRGAISVGGRRNGNSQTFATTSSFPDHELANDFIPKLWAARKVGFLSQRLRLKGNDPETLQELRETALRYGILSEYTSYLVQEPLVMANLQAAAAPPPTVGRAAVATAEASRMRREAKSVAAADQAAGATLGDASADTRTVGGRAFRNVGGTWLDMMHRDGANDVVAIEPFSDAYFAMLRALPELSPYWKTFTTVVVAGRHVSIKLNAGGAKQLNAARIQEIVKSFRT